jgi:hypothetical protein
MLKVLLLLMAVVVLGVLIWNFYTTFQTHESGARGSIGPVREIPALAQSR